MSIADRLKSGDLSRWLVALILIAPTLVCVVYPNKLFLLVLVGAVGGGAWGEYFNNMLGRERVGLLAWALAGYWATLAGATFFGTDGLILGLLLALSLGAAYFLHVLSPEQDRISVNLLARLALGHLYLTF